MPQLNTSDAVRQRINQLIARLIQFSNHELEGYEHLTSRINLRWLEEDSKSPRLVVKTQIRFLAELAFDQQGPKIKNDLKQDLRTLERFLEIFEDNRTRTQGASIWHFTLKLWHQRSVDINLTQLNAEWMRRKQKDSAPIAGEQLPGSSELRLEPLPARSTSVTSTPEARWPHTDSPHTDSPLVNINLRHNLPAQDYGRFIGREAISKQLKHLLISDQSLARISIKGMGGIGKTSLALHIAQCIIQTSRTSSANGDPSPFQAVIFASAQRQRFSSCGILDRYRADQSLLDIFRVIAQTLRQPELLRGDTEEQFDRIQFLLNQQRTLLIIDNLETIAADAKAALLSFLYDLPLTTKVLVTSREHVPLDTLIALGPLDDDAGGEFIQHHAQLKSIELSATEQSYIFQQTGGIPAAIVYSIGLLADGYPLTSVIPQLTVATGAYCRYYLANAVTSLTDHPAHRLLMALALFPRPAQREAIAQVGLGQPDNSQAAIEGFAKLQQRSLVLIQQGRYTLLPSTREYALTELEVAPDFELTVRERWIAWALALLQPFTSEDWREWQEHDPLHADWDNVKAVIEWCIEQNRYDQFVQFWPLVKGYTHIHGYWPERLAWLTWWIDAAQSQQDNSGRLQALRDKGWTLMLMGRSHQLTEAEACFDQVLTQSQGADLFFQLEFAIEYAILCLHQHQLDQAEIRLREAQSFLDRLETSRGEAYAKERIRIDYYGAEIAYRRGDFEQAQTCYQGVLVQARDIQWHQVEVYTLNWLADIALQQNQFDEAAQFLAMSLPLALRHQDIRSQAFHHKTQARLEQLKGNRSQFQEKAAIAIATFERLGMQTDIDEIQAWLAE